MSKLVVHAKIMIDGVSDTPKKDQLISIEDGKLFPLKNIMKQMKKSFMPTSLPLAFLTATFTLWNLSALGPIKSLV